MISPYTGIDWTKQFEMKFNGNLGYILMCSSIHHKESNSEKFKAEVEKNKDLWLKLYCAVVAGNFDIMKDNVTVTVQTTDELCDCSNNSNQYENFADTYCGGDCFVVTSDDKDWYIENRRIEVFQTGF